MKHILMYFTPASLSTGVLHHPMFPTHCLQYWLCQFPLIYLLIVSPLWTLLSPCSPDCRALQTGPASDRSLSYTKLSFAPSDGFIQTFWKCCLRGRSLSRIFRNGRKLSDACSFLHIMYRRKISILEV